MAKVVIGAGLNGLQLTRSAFDFLGLKWEEEDAISWGFFDTQSLPCGCIYEKNRSHPKLVQMAILLGERAGENIKVVNVPIGKRWRVVSDGDTDKESVEGIPEIWG